uniref:C2H2-type domain-containing protein n=1 Tax=Meloidogyne incognita TaxID=6306 RepID=A0A914M2H1_MELIC
MIYIKKANENVATCFCTLCNEEFEVDEYDVIDTHINAYHKDKGEHEGRHLHHDLTSQPSGHGSHGSHLEGHNVDPENYVYGSGSHTGGSNVYAPGSLDYAPGSLDYGSGSHTGGRDVYAPGSLDYGSGSHTGGSNVYAPGSLDYGSGSHTGGRDVYAPGYLDYAPGSLDYSSGIPQFGPGTQSVPGIQYHDIDYTCKFRNGNTWYLI